ALAAMKLALASLEAKDKIPELRQVIYHFRDWNEGFPIERFKADYVISWMLANYPPAQPTAVSVPDGYRLQPISEYDAMCAAMLQGAGRPQNEPQNIPENIPATQFKPVADLYGLTSPTGGETSFTFDAVEARDFIDGGWSCQEYVELGRFQEAMLQNGNSPAQSDCCPAQNCIAPALGGNSPVIADGWVACSERMPEFGTEIFYFCQDDGLRDCGIVSSSNFSGKGDAELYVHAEGYDLRFGVDISHWMPLPASPQQK
ncbi:TPA: DUF551 domain-containing protein, partial [Enterobacter hormaechei]